MVSSVNFGSHQQLAPQFAGRTYFKPEDISNADPACQEQIDALIAQKRHKKWDNLYVGQQPNAEGNMELSSQTRKNNFQSTTVFDKALRTILNQFKVPYTKDDKSNWMETFK